MAKLIVGQNDLATVNPNLAAEWHPSFAVADNCRIQQEGMVAGQVRSRVGKGNLRTLKGPWLPGVFWAFATARNK